MTRLLTPFVAVALAVGACSSGDGSVRAAEDRQIEQADFAVPLSLAGYQVEDEDIEELLADGRRPYLESAALYSIREEDDLLQATLQIGRFADDVDEDDEEFRDSLLFSIGAAPREARMGDHRVWITGADRQTLSIWFTDGHMLVLSTRDGFEAGRTVLRAALEIRP